jgi:hypothetical protein
MEGASTQDRIERLVEEEERLWRAAGAGGISAEERQRLEIIRAELDSCWAALRQRRAGGAALPDADVPDPPNELDGPEPEPPHLQRGSPHDDRPAPGPDEPRDIP